MGAGLNEKMCKNPKNGAIHIPSADRSNPSHPKGSFRYGDNILTPRPGKHICMNPGKENVWAEYTLTSAFLSRPKKYKLSMRFLTNKAHDVPLKLVIQQGDKELDTVNIPLPTTKNKWTTMDPIDLGVELGGTCDTILTFSHPKPEGKGICIRDFELTPQTQLTGEYSIEWLSNKLEDLETTFQEGLLALDPEQKQALSDQCGVAHKARLKWEQTKEGDAKKEAEKARNAEVTGCKQKAKPLRDALEPKLEAMDYKSVQGKQLLQAIVLAHGTPCELGEYASQGPEQKKRLQNLLEGDNDLMYQMLIHGGPRGGNYGRALDIYAEIEAKRQQGKSVLPKLSLAVALEFAEPHTHFQSKSVIDPIARYLHYEDAYLKGELEPLFETFTVWELRKVVDCDSPNEEIAWFRDMIWNYQPGICTMDDYHWRYAWIVRTDVHYKEPEWLRKPHDYIQILSGGGMCGPRAWMGRFACKAFGCPTWGVRQPGHAAVARWTPNGWETALGGGFHISWWEDVDGRQEGLDFECEAKVRASLGDEGYFRKVGILDCIGELLGENQRKTYLFANKVWSAMALLERKRLSGAKPMEKDNGQCEVLSKITEYKTSKPQKEEIRTEGGSIVVPISCSVSGKGLKLLKSVNGGHQAFVREGFEGTFKIPQKEMPEKKKYQLTVKYVTVHETDLAPLVVEVNKQEHEIPVLAHWKNSGKWQSTEPIELELGGAEVTVKLTRKEFKCPFTLKEVRLTAC